MIRSTVVRLWRLITSSEVSLRKPKSTFLPRSACSPPISITGYWVTSERLWACLHLEWRHEFTCTMRDRLLLLSLSFTQRWNCTMLTANSKCFASITISSFGNHIRFLYAPPAALPVSSQCPWNSQRLSCWLAWTAARFKKYFPFVLGPTIWLAHWEAGFGRARVTCRYALACIFPFKGRNVYVSDFFKKAPLLLHCFRTGSFLDLIASRISGSARITMRMLLLRLLLHSPSVKELHQTSFFCTCIFDETIAY